MIRLVLLLGAGLFSAMLIGGQDRGQLRFGLMPSEEPAVIAAVVDDQVAVAPVVAVSADPTASPIEVVSFAPAEPVMVAQATPVAAVEVQVETSPDAAKIMFVSSNSINVREGPGKDFGVVSRLVRGEAVLVVSAGEGADGWSLIRIEGDGIEGYVASRLLTE